MAKPELPLRRHWIGEALALPKVLAAPVRRPVQVEKFGQGQPVFVIPGMLANDASTSLLRRSLDAAGFVSRGWGDGINGKVSQERVDRVGESLKNFSKEIGQPVIVIGWSLGGLFTRILAQTQPDHVATAVTLGSPFSGDRRANHAWRLYQLLNDHTVDNAPFGDLMAAKPACKTIAFWSPTDGVIAGSSARGQDSERDIAVEMQSPHLTMCASRSAVTTILSVLKRELRAS